MADRKRKPKPLRTNPEWSGHVDAECAGPFSQGVRYLDLNCTGYWTADEARKLRDWLTKAIEWQEDGRG